MKKEQPILVLGASGWLGSYLIPELLNNKGQHILAGFSSHEPNFHSDLVLPFQLTPKNSELIESINPSVIVNLARGEEEIDFKFHQELIDFSNRKNIRYLYASSANAFDATPEIFNREDENPRANSEYG